MQFTVLLSIYIKEKPDYFNQALISIWDIQTLKPNEIVLVKDGPLTKELEDSIATWQIKLGDVLKIVSLDKNVGLGAALNAGLAHCSYNLVARMDTDDMSLPERFEKQIDYLKEHPHVDVLGSGMEEFNREPGDLRSYRILPIRGKKLLTYAKFRSPVNHPTVFFKKEIVLANGGYRSDILLFEDFALFIKLIKNKACFENMEDILLNFRVGDGIATIKRRSGWHYVKSELKFIKFALSIRYLNYYEAIISMVTKIPLRLLPPKFILFIYNKLLRSSV